MNRIDLLVNLGRVGLEETKKESVFELIELDDVLLVIPAILNDTPANLLIREELIAM